MIKDIVVNLTGGTFSITGTNAALIVGNNPTSAATVSLASNAARLLVAGDVLVGSTGRGVLALSAGAA